MSEYLPLRCVTIHFTDGSFYSTNVSALSTDKDLRDYFREGTLRNLGTDEEPHLVRIAYIEIHPDEPVVPVIGRIAETVVDGVGCVNLVIRGTGTESDGLVLLQMPIGAVADNMNSLADKVERINRRRHRHSLRPLQLQFNGQLFGWL